MIKENWQSLDIRGLWLSTLISGLWCYVYDLVHLGGSESERRKI